ncbi:MAG: hypothetical protein ACREXM_13815 [Gammaproteobacteria bacterium]
MTPSVSPALADVWPFSDIDTKDAAVDDRLHRQRAEPVGPDTAGIAGHDARKDHIQESPR